MFRRPTTLLRRFSTCSKKPNITDCYICGYLNQKDETCFKYKDNNRNFLKIKDARKDESLCGENAVSFKYSSFSDINCLISYVLLAANYDVPITNVMLLLLCGMNSFIFYDEVKRVQVLMNKK